MFNAHEQTVFELQRVLDKRINVYYDVGDSTNMSITTVAKIDCKGKFE